MEDSQTYEIQREQIIVGSRVKILEERFDRHLAETKDEMKAINHNLTEIAKSLNQFMVDQGRKDGETNGKIYAVTTLLTVIFSFVVSYFTTAFKVKS